MKPGRRRDPRGLASKRHPANLMRRSPCRAIRMGKHQGIARTVRRLCLEKPSSFVSQDDMPGFAAFRLANKDRAAIRVEVAGAKARQFAIAATRMQSGQNKIPEIALHGIY